MIIQQTNQLIVFARAPIVGTVKRRLATAIGDRAALEFYRETLCSLLIRMSNRAWKLTVAVASAESVDHPAFASYDTIAQVSGDLGHRMCFALDCFPSTNRIIIGSDIPDIEQGHIHEAFDALLNHDVVFGPAYDGGFWLAGCNAAFEAGSVSGGRFMSNVRWSTSHSLTDTLKSLPASCRVATVRTLADVDDDESYQSFLQRHGQVRVNDGN